jgi:hypothetical protein
MTTKMIIDATKPVQRPFSERILVPEEAKQRVPMADYVRESGTPAPAETDLADGRVPVAAEPGLPADG